MARQLDRLPTPIRRKSDDGELDRLLRPGCFYERPGDVLADPALSRSEQRAILSSWLSDAYAVESSPTPRQLPLATRSVTFDEIIDALLQLDSAGAHIGRQGNGGDAGDARGAAIRWSELSTRAPALYRRPLGEAF